MLKELFEIDEKHELKNARLVPPLKLCTSPKVADSPTDCSSMSYRTKKRNQIHRSLDFNMSPFSLLTSRVVKADHNILQTATPKATTHRQAGFGSTITVNNRRVARNIFLDSFPV